MSNTVRSGTSACRAVSVRGHAMVWFHMTRRFYSALPQNVKMAMLTNGRLNIGYFVVWIAR